VSRAGIAREDPAEINLGNCLYQRIRPRWKRRLNRAAVRGPLSMVDFEGRGTPNGVSRVSPAGPYAGMTGGVRTPVATQRDRKGPSRSVITASRVTPDTAIRVVESPRAV